MSGWYILLNAIAGVCVFILCFIWLEVWRMRRKDKKKKKDWFD